MPSILLVAPSALFTVPSILLVTPSTLLAVPVVLLRGRGHPAAFTVDTTQPAGFFHSRKNLQTGRAAANPARFSGESAARDRFDNPRRRARSHMSNLGPADPGRWRFSRVARWRRPHRRSWAPPVPRPVTPRTRAPQTRSPPPPPRHDRCRRPPHRHRASQT